MKKESSVSTSPLALLRRVLINNVAYRINAKLEANPFIILPLSCFVPSYFAEGKFKKFGMLFCLEKYIHSICLYRDIDMWAFS